MHRALLLAHVAPGFPPVYGGPDDLCREARHLSLFVLVAGLKTGSLDFALPAAFTV